MNTHSITRQKSNGFFSMTDLSRRLDEGLWAYRSSFIYRSNGWFVELRRALAYHEDV